MFAHVLIDVTTHASVIVTSLFVIALVTVPLHVSASRNAVAHAHDISVPAHCADVTVIALDDVVLTLDIINRLVEKTTVSVLKVNALIAVCILVAINAIVVSVEKFSHVMLLATQSIVMLNDQSVTAFRVAITVVADDHHVRNAGVYARLCLTTNLSLLGLLWRYDPIPFGYDPAVSVANKPCHGLIMILDPSILAFLRYGEYCGAISIDSTLSTKPHEKIPCFDKGIR